MDEERGAAGENELPDSTRVLVESAAAVAAQNIAAIHRRRVVTQAFCAGVLAALLVAAPIVYFLDRDRQRSAVERARFNCDQSTQQAAVQQEILQIGTDLRKKNSSLSQDPDVSKALLKLFGPELIKKLYGKQAANEREAVRMWNKQLAALGRLARIDCDRVIKPSGVETTPKKPKQPSTIANA